MTARPRGSGDGVLPGKQSSPVAPQVKPQEDKCIFCKPVSWTLLEGEALKQSRGKPGDKGI